MKKILTLWNRELTACFLSPIAYVTLVIFVAVTGGTFLVGVQNNDGQNDPIATLLFASVILWSTALITVVTMRSFAEEKRSKTFELLLTAPVTDLQVVMGKYLGAFSFILICLIPAIAQVWILDILSPGITKYTIDLGAVAGGCLILVLCSAMFTALGIFVSLLTENQIIAALFSFSLIWFVLLLSHILETLPLGLGDWISAVAVLEQVDDFSRGLISFPSVVFYLSSTTLLLFACVQTLSARRWK
jgi:ABC-2 type transport system permease protein